MGWPVSPRSRDRTPRRTNASVVSGSVATCCGGDISGGGATQRSGCGLPGNVTNWPHCGHCTRLPACSSLVLIFRPQRSQDTTMDMSVRLPTEGDWVVGAIVAQAVPHLLSCL